VQDAAKREARKSVCGVDEPDVLKAGCQNRPLAFLIDHLVGGRQQLVGDRQVKHFPAY
jgi:hypothetical protein